MKKLIAVYLILFCSIGNLLAQIDEKLKEDIKNTGYVHSPLPPDYSKAFETWALNKKVVASDMLCDM